MNKKKIKLDKNQESKIQKKREFPVTVNFYRERQMRKDRWSCHEVGLWQNRDIFKCGSHRTQIERI